MPNIENNQNIWRRKQFYETYKENKKLSPLVTQVLWINHLIMSGRNSDIEKEFYLRETILRICYE